jgi:hypothetical protein
MLKPFWFKGTPEEWNAIPSGAREELLSSTAKKKDRDAACDRWLAIVRKQEYNPLKEGQAPVPADKKAEPVFIGIRNWTEAVDGISAERIRNCIIFLLDVKRDQWYRANCSNRDFVRRFAAKMDAATPESYKFEVDPLLTSRVRHIDGENQPIVQTVIKRKPYNAEERQMILDEIGVIDYSIPFLAQRDCPKCKGDGYVEVSQYPGDPVFEKLTQSIHCECVCKGAQCPVMTSDGKPYHDNSQGR